MEKDDLPVLEPYNPLDKVRIGQSIAFALSESELHKFPLTPFIGAGVYAIYYRGGFEAYSRISALNSREVKYPIYVGKAAPPGARKGGVGFACSQGTSLYSRLSQHSQSLQKLKT